MTAPEAPEATAPAWPSYTVAVEARPEGTRITARARVGDEVLEASGVSRPGASERYAALVREGAYRGLHLLATGRPPC